MTAPAADSPMMMPSKPELVTQTIQRFDVVGLRSQLLELDTPTLEALGLMLVDRERTIADAIRWLNEELGGDGEDDPAVNQKAVYRFAGHFRRLFSQVRREHAQRIARLSVADATGGRVGDMHKVATARLVDLVAERLVETDTIEDLTSTELGAMISTLDGMTRADLKREELALKVAEGERKEAKLQADLDLARQKLSALPGKIDALQKQVDELSKRARRREQIPQGVFDQIKRDLGVLAAPERSDVNHEDAGERGGTA